MELNKEKRIKSIKQILNSKLKMNKILNPYSEEEKKYIILRQILEELLVDNECQLMFTDKFDKIEELIPLVNQMYTEDFINGNENQKAEMLAKFVESVCRYVGIANPELLMDFKRNVDFKYAKNEKELQKNEDTVDYVSLDYGYSTHENILCISVFTDKYMKQLSKYGFDGYEFKKYQIASYLMTIRHECQHLLQFAMINELNDIENITNEEILLLFCTLFINNALLEYKLMNDYEEDLFGINYVTEFVEYEARKSEFEFIVKLLECEGLTTDARLGLTEYLLEDLLENSRPFKQFSKPTSKFIDIGLNYKVHEFEKIFGTNPMAERILNLFQTVNKEELLDRINFDELEIIGKEYEYEKLLSILENNDDNEEQSVKSKNQEIDKVEKNNKVKECEPVYITSSCVEDLVEKE